VPPGRSRWSRTYAHANLRACSLEMIAGNCHCGDVGFCVASTIVELTTCDCSLCSMRNALMAKVHESALHVTRGQERLTCYEWNTKIAKHFFCSRCGIYVFHRKRAAPDFFGVNAYCLVNFDPASVPLQATS
jgi:hypothetical protein